MDQILLLLLVVFTSVGALWVGRKGLGLSASVLRQAVWTTLDGMGLTVVFLVVNLTVGGIAILAIRLVTGRFVSLYLLSDATLLGLSLLQGLILLSWWTPSDPSSRTFKADALK